MSTRESRVSSTVTHQRFIQTGVSLQDSSAHRVPFCPLAFSPSQVTLSARKQLHHKLRHNTSISTASVATNEPLATSSTAATIPLNGLPTSQQSSASQDDQQPLQCHLPSSSTHLRRRRYISDNCGLVSDTNGNSSTSTGILSLSSQHHQQQQQQPSQQPPPPPLFMVACLNGREDSANLLTAPSSASVHSLVLATDADVSRNNNVDYDSSEDIPQLQRSVSEPRPPHPFPRTDVLASDDVSLSL